MPTYSYRCPACGPFDIRVPMSALREQVPCRVCAALSARVFQAPYLATDRSAVTRTTEMAEASAENPQVVHHVPGKHTDRRPSPPSDPRHAFLPKW